MNRFFILFVLGFATLCTGAGVAGAQSIPDMKGSWTGTGKTIVKGAAPHHAENTAAKPAGKYKLSEIKFTITIEGQQDVRFWGTVGSPAKVEPAIGAISADGKRFRMVLQDGGMIDATLLNNDTFEMFYVETKGGVTAVGTNFYTRQK
jgi:hypothetical protein